MLGSGTRAIILAAAGLMAIAGITLLGNGVRPVPVAVAGRGIVNSSTRAGKISLPYRVRRDGLQTRVIPSLLGTFPVREEEQLVLLDRPAGIQTELIQDVLRIVRAA